MGLETASFINGLVESNPTSSDGANQGDNHLRLIKTVLKNTFPNITGAVTATQAQLNTAYLPLAGGTLTGGVTGTTASFPGGVTATVTGNASSATVLQTARTINGVAFNGSANISFGTDTVAEGATNLYFSNARVRAAISATGSLNYNSSTGVFSFTESVSSVAGRTGAVTLTSSDVAEGSRLYYTDARARASISAAGSVTYNAATGVISFTDAVTSVAGKTGAVALAVADITGLQGALDGKLSTSGGTITGSLTATGDITAFSDIRIKTNVETISEAIYKVKQLRGVSYINKINSEPRIGVIAQEVERVVPEVVHTHSNGLKSVAYQNLVGLLIEAIKDLEIRVAELENR
jgi:hypothetical protein